MPKNTPIRIIDSQKTRAASFLGGSASTGGTTDHGLLLGLNDDDHCFSADTELLTRRGFVGYQDISDADEALTLNTDTGLLEYQQVLAKYVYSDFTEMVSLHNRHGEILVTRGHTLLYCNTTDPRKGKTPSCRWLKCTAEESLDKSVFDVPVAAQTDGANLPLSDDMLELLGLVIAEGHFIDPKEGGYGIQIYQVEGAQADYIEALLGRVGAPYTRSVRQTVVFYIRSSWAREYIRPWLSEKNISDSLMVLRGAQFYAFLRGLILGDGSVRSEKLKLTKIEAIRQLTSGFDKRVRYSYHGGNVELIDRLAHLCTLNGLKAYAYYRNGGFKNGCWSVNITDRQHVLFGKGTKRIVPYTGDVWCVSVPNQTLVVRRKGFIFIAGNTQYLRTDGTRTLTGNMLVDASVTIDGVDISAHAANANAHHNQQHAITGSDHTVTGSQYQIVGLTSTNTLGLLTAASSPTANQIVKTDGSSMATLVDLTVTSDLFMTGTLDFGTNTIAEDATYLQVAGSKAVKFNQNIGNANWTLYNAGGYTTTGSVSITGTAGDLTVGSNVLFVDNSQANVGINMAPDSQFALDINGPARATYWIGPHAIQLKNVLLLAHYDGRYPYSSNFSGEPNGHMGQVASVVGDVIYRYGKFYKAGQFAAANTNLITNPRPDPGGSATGWNYSAGTAPTNAVSTNMPEGAVGDRVIYYANHQFGWPNTQSVTNGTAYYLTGWIIASTGGTVSFYLQRNSGSFDTISNTVALSLTANTWTRFTATLTATATTTARPIFSGYGANVSVCNWQFETAAVTPYTDGGLTLASTWTGTAHASTSTRAAAYLTYPTSGNITTGAFSVMAWVNVEHVPVTNQTIWRIDGSTSGYMWLRLVAGKPDAIRGSGTTAQAASAITARTWTHLAMTWDGTSTRLYVNGALVDTDTPSGAFSGIPASMHVGAAAGATEPLNGLIDDLCILGYASPAAEIKSIYESNAPVFAETSTFNFRPTPKGLLWADDEGLWMRDTSGNPVFGIYGGESYKNWGGFDMYPGDLLIGRSMVGVTGSAILWDQSAGTFGFYGAGNATAQASVATDGSITAGAGALALNASGIQITAPSSQSSIGSYKFLVTGKTITSGMYAYYNSGADTYYHGLYSDSSNIGNITTVIGSTLGGGGTAKVQFNVTNSLASANTTYTLSGSTATWQMADYVGIGVAPTRPFQVLGGVFAGGESTGLAGYTQFTNANSGVSTGVGTVKMNGSTARDSAVWIKIYIGTTAYWLPAWSNIS